MPRELTGHKVNPANDVLNVTVLDEPGAGGASHLYRIDGFDTDANPSQHMIDGPPWQGMHVLFQNGPIAEAGVNGITHEVLLAILIDRMEGFEAGPYGSAYNRSALWHLREAQTALLDRTRDRMARNVEGTRQV